MDWWPLLLRLLLLAVPVVGDQQEVTLFDGPIFTAGLRLLRDQLFGMMDNKGDGERRRLELARKHGKLQDPIPMSVPFPCHDSGTAMRSVSVPRSVHKLRPGDIDVVGALGDSITAGTGIVATNMMDMLMENRGLSWSIGGLGTWREYLTLPNILKVFNPNVYGYATSDSFFYHKASMFNAAEIAAMTQDLPHQTKALILRMKHDRHVNMRKHWKLVTLQIGQNDFCSKICYMPQPTKILAHHRQNLLKALRLLRDHSPRTVVNVVATVNVNLVKSFHPRPSECITLHTMECSCMTGARFQHQQDQFAYIMQRWNAIQQEVANRDEFHNRTDFTVNYQPYVENATLPRMANGDTDRSYASIDCFHISQKGHALVANSYWNNMLQPDGRKSYGLTQTIGDLRCPTACMPYLRTRENSRQECAAP